MGEDHITADICIIGAGSGGLSVAAGAAQLGVKTVLIERAEMGGDCLNTGCVPSKALIAAASKAYNMTSTSAFGISPTTPQVDFPKVQNHIKDVIATIEPNDSQERFEGLGATVIRESARFISPKEVQAGNTIIKARRFVIATGSSAGIPPIEGLKDVPYFTNETIFDNQELPSHLVVIGGGPIGMEMAQAHRRLGAEVTVMEMFSVLPKDDPDLTKVVIDQFEQEGINLLEGVNISKVEDSTTGLTIHYSKDNTAHTISASHILVAAGRTPNVKDLSLEAANIEYTPRGVTVDSRLRTTNKNVFAIGDVAGGLQFTHVAGYQAGLVIRNALFRLPAKNVTSATPWITYTDPELSHVGLTEAQAREAYGDAIRILTWPLHENDRAIAERKTEGLVKAITTKRGKILGASIVGAHAGELIQPWVLAISNGLKIGALANMISPYPTLGEINKRAAGSFYTPSLFSNRTKSLVRFLAKFG